MIKKNKIGALVGAVLLALGLAACGSSSSSPSSSSSTEHFRQQIGDDLRSRLNLRGTRLRTVGLLLGRRGRNAQLPGRRLGRGHHLARG